VTLRVLSLSTLFPNTVRPAFGGFVGNQMAALMRRGDIDLTMIAPVGAPPWPLSLRAPYAALAKVPAESSISGALALHPRFRLLPLIGGDGNARRLASALLPLIRQLHAERPFDLVDAQFFFPDGPAAAIIANEIKRPLTIKARGSDILMWGHRPRALAQIRAAANQSALMLAVSAELKRDMIALGLPGDRIAVHYTGLDRSRFAPIPRGDAREKLGLSNGSLLLATGSLIAIKGQALAIQALTELPGSTLALAGAGPDEDALRALAAKLNLLERVRFLGQVSHAELPVWLSAANALVLPSEREGLANAWIEALACGTPLIIPDIGGAREVVETPSAGRIVLREPVAIAAGVREVLAADYPQAEVATNAARFSWDANAAELSAHFHSVVGRA
jgi:glycosyltransferase involved in cell wall biosynthesis